MCAANAEFLLFWFQLSGVGQRLSIASFDDRSGPVERAIREEGLSRCFFEEDLIVAKEMIDLVALFEWDEEDLALSSSPDAEEII